MGSGGSDFLVRLGPPARGDTIHRASCHHARGPSGSPYGRNGGQPLRWSWADEKGYANIDWDALRRHGIKPCRHCLADLLREPGHVA